MRSRVAQISAGFSLFEILMALTLSSLLGLLAVTLIRISFTNFAHLRAQRMVWNEMEQMIEKFALRTEAAGFGNIAPIDWNAIDFRAINPKDAEKLSLRYRKHATSSILSSDCGGASTVYDDTEIIHNIYHIITTEDSTLQRYELRCSAYRDQGLALDVTNLRVRYGVDLGRYQDGEFVVDDWDGIADVYLDSDHARAYDQIVSVKIGMLSAAPQRFPYPAPEQFLFGQKVHHKDAVDTGYKLPALLQMSYPLPNAQ